MVVVGGGISGLTAAFRLIRGGLRVAVLEAAPRVGGAIETLRDGGWLAELGPNTVLESHPEVGELIRDCGLAAEKLVAAPAGKRRYVWKDETLVPLPLGPVGFLRTPLFPPSAKLRLLREPWIPRPARETEESIAGFVRRRLGPAFLDYAVGPFVSGVYAGDPERLAVRWAVPRIAALEAEHGSLIRGALAKKKGPAPRGGMISFRDGLDALPLRLAAEVGELHTGCAVRGLRPTGGGFEVESPEMGDRWSARRVVLAVPADAAAQILVEATNGASRLLGEVPYAPVALVSLGFRRADVKHSLGGFGFLAPRREPLRILGCLFPSSLFPGRAPEGHVLLTAFAGGRTDPAVVAWDEERLVSLALREIDRALGLRGQPVFRAVRRWPRAIPQYEIGHGRFAECAMEIERALPGLHLAGNFLGGVSVPDCIRRGAAVARAVLEAEAQ